ncbi:hypothetical protein MYCTH_2310513 [Thermothelomyces thermophilus ATCC 42464]|uniref:RING-type domain-containing protein n=1 Tax=Thermothelomyces thermophilus (strain ATCC 42464 / BCRC 31852 / DSM 1799) TaxID=573729 RepID=G2QLL7_THET4|nr:uncharacterized protein MYCTH_2310513 [Thermothelomyces thermophilus ATCC 42464]AEO60847.1 hypothetical protein MYCTH_2310513 [Thermothelomyces thermophilus ATCC 42464]
MVYANEVVFSDSPTPLPSPSPLSLPQPDYFDDLVIDDYFPQFVPERSPAMSPILRPTPGPDAEQDGTSRCEEIVLDCFPDICPDYLKSQVSKHEGDSQSLITELLDNLENGQSYPKRSNSLKRKRREDEDEDEEEKLRKKFEGGDPRLASNGPAYVSLYLKTAKSLLKASFPERYVDDIESAFKANNQQLYTTYLLLDEASWNPEARPMRIKRVVSRQPHPEEALRTGNHEPAELDALEAFDAARAICAAKAQARKSKEAEERRKTQEEEENLQRARADGTVAECGCCYDELALNRMVHCDGENTHWFCRPCARKMAEHAIGLSKHRLGCMSVEGCDGTFSKDQKELFLDDKLTTALELIEQEEVLRLAGIDGLEHCPFCRFAAEYPSVGENKEFRCENPECRLVSCRLCRRQTHIPKTCEEAAEERGISARRRIEEAMSAALIRKCNKCGAAFIKENGCNKMRCTRAGCGNVQCYVCSKSCDYSHFDDRSRGGKRGNCPLFDDVEQRHRNEVRAAEELARKQVASENPDLNEDLLKVNFSEQAEKDDERRRTTVNPAPPPFPFVQHNQPAVFAPWQPFAQVLTPQTNLAAPAGQAQAQQPRTQQGPAAQMAQAGALPFYVPNFANPVAQLGMLGVPVAPVATMAPANGAVPLVPNPEQNARRALSEGLKAAWEVYRRVTAHTSTAANTGASGKYGTGIPTTGVSRALFGGLASPNASAQGPASQARYLAQPIIQPDQNTQEQGIIHNAAGPLAQQFPWPFGGFDMAHGFQGGHPPPTRDQGGA